MKGADIVVADTSFVSAGYSDLYTYSEYDKTLIFNTDKSSGKVDIVSGLYLNDHIKNDLNNSRLYNISFPALTYSRKLNESYSKNMNLNHFFFQINRYWRL